MGVQSLILFVRAGSIITTVKPMEYLAAQNGLPVTANIFFIKKKQSYMQD